MLRSEQIRFVAQLVDIRHAPMASDIETFRWLVEHGLPVLLVATKADKLGREAGRRQAARLQRAFGVPELEVLPYSSLTGEGREAFLETLADALTA